MMRFAVDRCTGLALAAVAAGLLSCVAGGAVDVRAMLAAWLTTALFLIGLPLGALTILMVHGLTGGRWGEAVRQPLRTLVATLPLGLLFLLPVLFRLDLVFPWASTDGAALPETVREKLAYLNVPFFLLRFVVCAAIWLSLAWLVLGWTAEDESSDRRDAGKGCAVGLIVHGVAVTVFAIDWMLSLEPEFTSTIYAFLEAASEVVGAFTLAMIMLAAKRAIEILPGGEEDVALSEDVANMAFGFMLMWAYLAFMQWLVIWGGDLPEEIHWYVIRSSHGWQYLLWLLIAGQFALPLAAFLSRDVKRSHAGLLGLAGIVLAGHFIDIFWRIRPALFNGGAQELWCDLAAMAGAGGLWLALLFFLAKRPDVIALWRRRPAHG
ncbi:hypothetical protein FJ938_11285 [Mesorhizobium sp. B2-4-14]|uniref:hypothetical protein n=1 Tax=Mesorhizobium sp. B2-4-14 TaxID=2589935 RepID=UPI00112BD880|nr:hypothetical protein [Mesorhizobium sp. B2-4-14]TPL07087.1 hypothetical protein FJ938_11285 [Mesorhizobium sp. B2-4-14]